jgi:hypothetical protein
MYGKQRIEPTAPDSHQIRRLDSKTVVQQRLSAINCRNTIAKAVFKEKHGVVDNEGCANSLVLTGLFEVAWL